MQKKIRLGLLNVNYGTGKNELKKQKSFIRYGSNRCWIDRITTEYKKDNKSINVKPNGLTNNNEI